MFEKSLLGFETVHHRVVSPVDHLDEIIKDTLESVRLGKNN